ncbi:MAG TPA: ethanolamine ammonia-lyase reactivating factor EutA [Chloroflexota bacterium]|jgi:ethanolamine utilization protein EutA|nr:ethanolamine ammonia-lyase reactivating factor EutA [Chloroflexota bacterium]
MAETPAKGAFTAPEREMGAEDHIELTSVGVDIGSSTSHLLFSRIVLERVDNRYQTVERRVLHESDILFTPYVDETTIDGNKLGYFISRQYDLARLHRADVDTGALILTGVALLRDNARAIGELFSQEAGKFVAVSAGDNLESTMAAHGSGAAERSREIDGVVVNVDIGGGTTKLVVCRDGRAEELAAIDVGARLVAYDENGTIVRLEPAGREIARAVGLNLKVGGKIDTAGMRAMAAYMAGELFKAIPGPEGAAGTHLTRTPNLSYRGPVDELTFSGGVSEFVYERQKTPFNDLGQILAEEIRARLSQTRYRLFEPPAGIRATVIGASQYTIQVSGSTIFLAPLDVVPLRNMPVVAPIMSLEADNLHPESIERAIIDALTRFDLLETETPVALAFQWRGSATWQRLDDFCTGVTRGLKRNTDRGNPLVLVNDGDIGGLLGIHIREEMSMDVDVVSIDGVELREFDFIDIGALLPASGAVPVVIKSLVFPASGSNADR